MENNVNIAYIIKKQNNIFNEREGHRKKFWFNDIYMFKYQKLDSLESYGEIFIYYLAQKINLPCAKYTLNYYFDNLGVVTESFLSENETLITGADLMIDLYDEIINYDDDSIDIMMKKNNIFDIPVMIKDYAKKYKLKLQTYNLSEQIIRICIFDLLTLQTDRNPFNWGVIINRKKRQMRIAPLYDNSNLAYLNKPNFINEFLSNYNFETCKKALVKYYPLLSVKNDFSIIDTIKYFIKNDYNEFTLLFTKIRKNYQKVFDSMKKDLKNNYSINFEKILKNILEYYYSKIEKLIEEEV